MKLNHKLLVAPILTALILYLLSFASNLLLQQSRVDAEQQVTVVLESLKVFTDAQDQLGRVHASAYRTVSLAASLDEAKIKSVKADIDKQVGTITNAVAAAVQADGNDDVLQQSVIGLQKQLTAYAKQAQQALDMASFDPNTGAVTMQDADAIYSAIGKSLGDIVAHAEKQVSNRMEGSRARSQTISNLLSVLGLVVALAAVALAVWVQKNALTELARAVAVTNEVAGGNLQVDTHSDRTDEIGDLMRALGRMCEQLNGVMTQVLQSSDSIRTSSAEIASGTLDLSGRTEQTASNLAQTASSMDQLTKTVRQSADSARTANHLATTAAQVAARGGEQVSHVVSTMDEISTSSRKIGDIIGVVDGIAFQTNILALNAAVEAARAGEQGRGFAVVASEVRSLAGRSAEAAREIKALIGASLEKVEGGSRLVSESGQTMEEIVGSVQSVTDIIASITSAADGQSNEIGHVNDSIAQLDQMTQQNAALVEQSSAAAESLKEQAAKLSQVVATFHLRNATDTPAALKQLR